MSTMKKIVLILAVCTVMLAATSFVNPLLGLISAAVEAAPGPWVGEQITVAEKNNSEFEPDVAFNWKHNEYLVVWRGVDGIYGQRVSTTGKLVGPKPFAIATGPKTRRSPSVDYDPVHDRYLVVWSYDKGSTEGWNINGRFIPWGGPDPILQEFLISKYYIHEEYPKVAYARAQEEFLVVWVNKDTTNSEIWGVRLKSSDGTFLGPGHPEIISGAGDYCDHPDLAFNLKRSEYLVVWDYKKSSMNKDIYGVRLSGDLSVLLPGILKIAEWPDNETYPAVAAMGDADQYLVVWQSELTSTNQNIFGRIVFGDAGLSTTVHQIEWTPVHELYPDVASDRSGKQFLVVWQQQYSSTSGPYAISGRFVYPELGGGSILYLESGATAEKVDTMGVIFPIVSPYQGDPNRTKPAAAGGFTQFLTVWEYMRKGSTDQDIHGKLVMPGAKFLPLVMRK